MKKGFTLIELLAVILILGIIALIAIPLVSNVIDEAKKEAAKVSAINFINAVDNYVIMQELQGYTVRLENGVTYNVSDKGTSNLSLSNIFSDKVFADSVSDTIYLNEIITMKGDYPVDGYVTIMDNKVDDAILAVSGYVAEYDKDNVSVKITGKYTTDVVKCNYDAGSEWIFETAEEHKFVIPCSGTYKLEVWGAQGGNGIYGYKGGYGGYSVGTIDMDEDTELFINVGGKGLESSRVDPGLIQGGYNGGGSSNISDSQSLEDRFQLGSGGGATSIAFVTGTIKEIGYESFVTKDKGIMIAAGGGGSSYYYNSAQYYGMGNGGSGGGYIGNPTNNCTYWRILNTNVKGALQVPATGLGNGQSAGSFGQGANYNVGGGGGLYGGNSQVFAAGSGGSGYIGNTLLKDNAMYCYDCEENDGIANPTYKTISTTGINKDSVNCPSGYSIDAISKCAKSGDGFAKITLISVQ